MIKLEIMLMLRAHSDYIELSLQKQFNARSRDKDGGMSDEEKDASDVPWYLECKSICSFVSFQYINISPIFGRF